MDAQALSHSTLTNLKGHSHVYQNATKSTQKSTKHLSLNTITNKCNRSRKPKAFSEASFVCLEFLACDACAKFEELCLSLEKARTREQISKDSQIRLSFVCLRGFEKRAAFEKFCELLVSLAKSNPSRQMSKNSQYGCFFVLKLMSFWHATHAQSSKNFTFRLRKQELGSKYQKTVKFDCLLFVYEELRNAQRLKVLRRSRFA